jgi:hypothetical protein
MFDPVIVVVSRLEIETRDTSGVIDVLQSCIASTDRALSFFENASAALVERLAALPPGIAKRSIGRLRLTLAR